MAGYSGTPLVKKLGLKEGFKVALINPPENYFDLLGNLPEGVEEVEKSNSPDFVHIFTNRSDELEKELVKWADILVRNGMIWVSWYKKASKLPSEITEDEVRRIALPMGLVDVKVCAVDENWSGLKLMIRVENR